MSYNQYRGEKSDSYYRKPGGRPVNSVYQRVSSGVSGKSGGGTGLPPASSNYQSSSYSTSRGFRRSNGQGAQSRSTVATANSEFRVVQNVADAQPSQSGTFSASVSYVPVKPTESQAQKSNQNVPRAPPSQSMSATSDPTAPSPPTTPVRGDTSDGVSLQFGSFSPGFMDRRQIPARTSSAPPNLDEQKRDQARYDIRSATMLPTSVISMPQQPREDAEQSKSSIHHPPAQAKRDVRSQVPGATVVSSSRNSSTFPVSGVSMTVPFQPSQVPVQFGVPGPQISAQGVTATSLQMPMALSVGNPSQVFQQVFVPGFQPHQLQAQGMMHQGQTMRFPPQAMAHPLSSQFGNSGLGISPQLSQQQAGNFGTPRISVKITHPETHEELRLGKKSDTSLDAVSLSNVPLHTQPSFGPSHQMNFPHRQPNPSFFRTPTSLSLASTQMGPSSQTSGFNYVGGQVSQVLTSVQVTVNPTVGHDGEKAVPSSLSVSSIVGDMSTMTKFSGPSVELSKIRSEISIQHPKSIPQSAPSVLSSPTTEPSGSPSGNDYVEKLNPFKDQLKKQSKKDQRHSGPQQQGKTSHSADISTMNTSREVAKAPDEMQFPCPSEVETSTSVFTGSSPGLETSTSSEEATLDSSETCGDFSAPTGEFSPDVHASVPIATAERTDIARVGECPDSETLNESNTKTGFDILKGDNNAKQDCFTSSNTQLKDGIAERQRTEPSEQLQLDLKLIDDVNVPADSYSLDSLRVGDQFEDVNTEEATFCNEHNAGLENEKIDNNHLSYEACSEKGLISDALTNRSDCKDGQESSVLVSEATHPDTVPNKNPLVSETVSEVNEKVSEKAIGDLVLDPAPGRKDKATAELNSVNINPAKGKKKRRDFLLKAEATGLTSDLYMAYKGPEEKPQLSISAESVDSSSNILVRPVSSSSNEEDVASKENGKSKTELDDWEDAADISNQKLEILDDTKDVHGDLRHSEADDNGVACRNYSRDFLLTLSRQCSDLPAGFEIPNDVVEALMGSKAGNSKVVELNRITDRPSGASRQDYRGNGMAVDDRWIKSPGPFAVAADPRLDIGQGGNSFGFRVGQGGNQGGLRNLRGQTPAQYVGGYLSGPLPPLASPGGIQRGGADADRWQRAGGYQKGLIPSPQSPLQVMHKAAKKYELRQITDVEEAKQRQLKAILNKLTPQNFERLFEQVKEVNIDNAITLTGVISQIFDKALTEPTFCEMYANFCYHLAGELPDFVEDNEKVTFKRLLLNKCQEEFERGEREQAEADRVEGNGEVNQSKEEREEKRTRARRRMLGNIRLIGELYKKKMLTERIMHECIKKLLGEYLNPDEEDIEALCKLMSTIGEMIDHPKAKEHMDAYFNMMANLSNNMNLSSRLRFMLKDAIDLRLNRWQQRRKIEGPKKIEELHRDAAQERQAQVSRLTRGPSIGSSARRGQPPDFGHWGSTMLPSPNTQMAFRGMPSQVRGFGTQDIRTDIRTLLGPIQHRPIDDNAITLGPQGGLARGMSVRGQPIISGTSLSDISYGHGESTRMPGGPNGYSSSVSEWTSHNTRQEPMSRYVQDRFTRPAAYEQSYPQEHSVHYGKRDLTYADRSFDRSRPVSPATQMQVSSVVTPNSSSVKVWPEERLRSMSMAAIREFYSARDENEVALCIKDLNSPSFHPSMISIWVNDSFERKDWDRNLLAGLLVNLTKNVNSILSPVQLIKGFESVLATLEDTVTDAPKAAEFLGHMIGRIIIENVVSLGEIGKLIQQGGEEPGRLLQVGLGHEVLQSAFEIIRIEKGQSVLDDICRSSNLQLEDFRFPVAGK